MKASEVKKGMKIKTWFGNLQVQSIKNEYKKNGDLLGFYFDGLAYHSNENHYYSKNWGVSFRKNSKVEELV